LTRLRRTRVEDATVVMPGVFHPDRAAMHRHMAAGFAGQLKGSRALDEPQSVRVLRTDAAIVVSRSGILMAGEDAVPAEREVLATWVLARQDGAWRIAAYANAPARPVRH
jgi:uncharacterized protein (TIGR02246 family)